MTTIWRKTLNSITKRIDRVVTTSRSVPTEDAQARKRIDEIGAVNKELQILLQLKYSALRRSTSPLPSFDDVHLRAYSQHGEDGILLFLFSLLGTTNRRCVEICAGDGIECNTANLIINHGWDGLLVDGNKRNVEIGKQFYKNCKNTGFWPPKFVHAWITTDSVNSLIHSQDFSGPVDLLSLDIDGNDYWIWQAIEAIEPRVVVLEYQITWGADHSVTQRYDPMYVWKPNETPLGGVCGASLPAFVNLGRRRGYRLVGIHSCNAFFVREGLGEDILPECPVGNCFNHRMARFAIQRRIAYERQHGSLIGDDWLIV